jgi:hypothetical protein
MNLKKIIFKCIIWTMKFSSCGRLLATAGKDKLIRIWVLKSFVDSFKDLLRRNSSTSNPPDNDQEISTGNNFFKRNVNIFLIFRFPFLNVLILTYLTLD